MKNMMKSPAEQMMPKKISKDTHNGESYGEFGKYRRSGSKIPEKIYEKK